MAGEPWFVAADVCRALAYNVKANGDVNTTQALRNAEEHGVLTTRISDIPGKPPKLVSESGLYKLIIQSRKPEAREFKNWVTRDVLPDIRKDGAYMMGEEKVATGELDETFFVPHAMEMLKTNVDRLTEERDALKHKVDHLSVREWEAPAQILAGKQQHSGLAS